MGKEKTHPKKMGSVSIFVYKKYLSYLFYIQVILIFILKILTCNNYGSCHVVSYNMVIRDFKCFEIGSHWKINPINYIYR